MLEPRSSFRDKELLIRQELARVVASQGSLCERVPREIRKILDYANSHLFDEGLNVDAILRACRLRNHNISSRFKLVIGISIRDHIEGQRMEVASRLLGHPELEIYLISASLGYAHQESFSRAFRRRFGYTPSEYRSRLSAESEDEVSRSVVKRQDQES
jgi:AraC-like DNA-binding protein